MSEWKDISVGQKVVCVDDDPHGEWARNSNMDPDMHGLTAGSVYTIRAFGPCCDGTLGLHLVEINRPVCVPFHHSRFELPPSKAIELFRKIARDVTEGRKVRIGA